MRIKWLVADVPPVESPDRVEHAVLGLNLAGRVFLPIQDIFVVAEPLCDVGTFSGALVTLVRVI